MGLYNFPFRSPTVFIAFLLCAGAGKEINEFEEDKKNIVSILYFMYVCNFCGSCNV